MTKVYLLDDLGFVNAVTVRNVFFPNATILCLPASKNVNELSHVLVFVPLPIVSTRGVGMACDPY